MRDYFLSAHSKLNVSNLNVAPVKSVSTLFAVKRIVYYIKFLTCVFFLFFLQELLDSKQRGRERLNRVQRYGAVARDYTGSGGYEAMEREEAALLSSWEQWERVALQTRASLETSLSQISSSEQEFSSLSAQLEQDLQDFSRQLQGCRLRLCQAEKKNEGEEAVKGWQMAKVGLRV